jgi:uncharacterized membrane protein YdbT with pleckstrin-like domain
MRRKSIEKGSLEKEETLWSDTARIFGLPISFTHFILSPTKLTCRRGLLNIKVSQLRLYRVLDIELRKNLGQRIFGVGSVVLHSADMSDRIFVIKNVKDPEDVKEFMDKIIEKEREAKKVIGREMFGTGYGEGNYHG